MRKDCKEIAAVLTVSQLAAFIRGWSTMAEREELARRITALPPQIEENKKKLSEVGNRTMTNTDKIAANKTKIGTNVTDIAEANAAIVTLKDSATIYIGENISAIKENKKNIKQVYVDPLIVSTTISLDKTGNNNIKEDNFKKGYETLSLPDPNSELVKFLSSEYSLDKDTADGMAKIRAINQENTSMEDVHLYLIHSVEQILR